MSQRVREQWRRAGLTSSGLRRWLPYLLAVPVALAILSAWLAVGTTWRRNGGPTLIIVGVVFLAMLDTLRERNHRPWRRGLPRALSWLRVGRRGSGDVRCAWCHGALRAPLACPGCGVCFHAACAEELGERCGTLGCTGVRREGEGRVGQKALAD